MRDIPLEKENKAGYFFIHLSKRDLQILKDRIKETPGIWYDKGFKFFFSFSIEDFDIDKKFFLFFILISVIGLLGLNK